MLEKIQNIPSNKKNDSRNTKENINNRNHTISSSKRKKEKTHNLNSSMEMNKKFEASKGYRFVRKDDLLQQAENLKKKKETYQKYQKAIDRIKGEALILDRTINILKEKTPDGEEILKKFEEKNGKVLNQAKRELEILATRKQEIDESKALTLEEYAKLINPIKIEFLFVFIGDL